MNGYTLLQVEKEIKNNVMDLFKKNHSLALGEMVKELCITLNHLEKRQIERYIKNMIKNGSLLIGSRATKKNISSSIERLEIFDFITKNPGKTLQNLSNSLDINVGKIIWHLTLLKKFQFIEVKKEKKENTYYPNKIYEGFN